MKIIILTGKFGMGHYSAAKALAEQIKEEDRNAEVLITDLYELAFSKYCNLLYGAYSSLVGKGCKLYNLAYKNVTNAKASSNEKSKNQHNVNMLYKYFIKCIEKYFQDEKPDVVIATYSLCAYLISQYKQTTAHQLPLITCITDVTTHSVWTNENTDLYLVAEECTKKSLISQGVQPEKIASCGIPVKLQFYQHGKDNQQNIHPVNTSFFSCEKQINGLEGKRISLLHQEKQNSEKKELLIMGGGLGLLPQNPEFYKQLDGIQGVHTTVITGKNKSLYKKLLGKYRNITVLGYTDQVCELMRNADLMITKPGGISIFEAIHSQVPMLICKPFLEQEIKNGKFIEENHLGIVLEKKPEKAVKEIYNILFNETLLNQIKGNMYRTSQKLNYTALFEFLSLCQNHKWEESNVRGVA